ncbi:hypothetical protein NVSP9465_00199 [Novosphingobium sp. CECT 9465]|nr:hypothetical protein NVSP9465_00199 [Novosphingobium sp. CECT 9465]
MLRAAVLIAMALLLSSFWLWSNRQFSIDACLDVGGAWDYSSETCRHA